MRLRLTKVDEFQILTCIKHELWGSKSARFKPWSVGDKVAIIVDKSLAALAEVSGRPFESREKVWDNGIFPHRIPLKFTHLLTPKDRPPILGEVRDALTQQWGPRYGWAILNQQVLESPNSDFVTKAITSRPNALSDYQECLLDRLEEARLRREQALQHRPHRDRPTKAKPAIEQSDLDSGRAETERESSAHTKTQSELIALGKVAECSVWVASNDQNRTWGGKALGDDCLRKLPSMGLNDEAIRRIALIDVIWISENAPAAAFEIETSTSVYSGLLRMSDLLSVVPALKIQIFIVAPRERQNKVLSELGRPTFRKIGLSEYCRYIPSEDLAGLIAKVKDFGGDIRPSILDKIAIPLEDDGDDEESP